MPVPHIPAPDAPSASHSLQQQILLLSACLSVVSLVLTLAEAAVPPSVSRVLTGSAGALLAYNQVRINSQQCARSTVRLCVNLRGPGH